MKVSYFETGRYQAPTTMPAVWPMPPGAYDQTAGAQVYQGMVERIAFVEQLGFDWVSLSEHHYSPRILTPSPPVAAAYICGPGAQDQGRAAGSDRIAQQPDTAGRGTGDAGHDVAGGGWWLDCCAARRTRR